MHIKHVNTSSPELLTDILAFFVHSLPCSVICDISQIIRKFYNRNQLMSVDHVTKDNSQNNLGLTYISYEKSDILVHVRHSDRLETICTSLIVFNNVTLLIYQHVKHLHFTNWNVRN